jgi:hypothetical protein
MQISRKKTCLLFFSINELINYQLFMAIASVSRLKEIRRRGNHIWVYD